MEVEEAEKAGVTAPMAMTASTSLGAALMKFRPKRMQNKLQSSQINGNKVVKQQP